MNEQTHNIEIKITSNHVTGEKTMAAASITGDGGIEHMIHAFQAALVVAGFAPETAAKLGKWEV